MIERVIPERLCIGDVPRRSLEEREALLDRLAHEAGFASYEALWAGFNDLPEHQRRYISNTAWNGGAL